MINPLLLHTNKDIPFRAGFCTIHNPSIEEIGMIGEETFQVGIRFLNFSKENLDDKDKNDLLDKSDFDILIAMMNLKEYSDYRLKAEMVLSLLFPSFDISIEKDKIVLARKDSNFNPFISARNYDEFKEIINEIFILTSNDIDSGGYNPEDKAAERLVKIFEDRKRKLNKMKGLNENSLEKQSIYGRVVSVLSIGLGMDKNILMKYTVYQLMESYKRYQLNLAYEMNIKARLAGATDIDDPPDWQDNILL